MVRLCVIRECRIIDGTAKHQDRSFHRFPKNEELRQKWIRILGLPQPLHKNIYLCDRHFTPMDYCTYFLKKTSYPTKNIPGKTDKPRVLKNSGRALELFKLGSSLELHLRNVENYIKEKNITNDLYRTRILVHSIAPTDRAKIAEICLPKNPDEFKYEDIINICKELFLKPNDFSQARETFYKRDQLQGEALQEYANELEILAQACNFGEFHLPALRGRFIMGINDEQNRNKILNLGSVLLTFDEMQEACNIEEKENEIIKLGYDAEDDFVDYLEENYIAEETEEYLEELEPEDFQTEEEEEIEGSAGASRKNIGRSISLDKYDFEEMSEEENELICFNCNDLGHLAYKCPYKQFEPKLEEEYLDSADQPNAETDQLEFNGFVKRSKSEDRLYRETTEPQQCFICADYGHPAHECPSRPLKRKRDSNGDTDDEELMEKIIIVDSDYEESEAGEFYEVVETEDPPSEEENENETVMLEIEVLEDEFEEINSENV